MTPKKTPPFQRDWHQALSPSKFYITEAWLIEELKDFHIYQTKNSHLSFLTYTIYSMSLPPPDTRYTYF